jgi:2-methylcitrate dehydratase PrpD
MDGNTRVADFIHNARWEMFPGEVQRKAKIRLLDVLGAAISGTITRVSKITAEYASHAYRGDEATILMHGKRATAAGAAFANGYAANGFDSDDGGIFTKGHPGAQLFPTTLALSEKLNKSGAEMLAGMVVGYEVAFRAGRCWHDHHEVWQACGSWGSMANAAAAAHLMNLEPEIIKHALGIAEYHAPNLPMMRDIDDPAMVKHGIGWGAMTGITAAELAASGFTGIPSLLGFEQYQKWVANIGEHYHLLDGDWFKTFASCGFGHNAVWCVQDLMANHDIRVDQIAHVKVETYHESVRLGAELPTTTEEAQFNTAWPLAAFMLEGEIGPRQMRDERLNDETIINLARKIELIESPEFAEWATRQLNGDPDGRLASQVTITLEDGTVYDSGVSEAYGNDDGSEWDEPRIETKFRWLLEDIIPEKLIDELVEMVWAFDELDNVHALTARLEG